LHRVFQVFGALSVALLAGHLIRVVLEAEVYLLVGMAGAATHCCRFAAEGQRESDTTA